MKTLSREEMKNVMGGNLNPGYPCNVPADCGANNCDNPQTPSNTKHWDCRNHVCTYDTACI